MNATSIGKPRLNRRRALQATTAALSLGVRSAYATCSDGSALPNDGMVVSRDPQILTGANWSHSIFAASGGRVFVPDHSVNEAHKPTQPLIRAYGV
jgi:hypothetical protein